MQVDSFNLTRENEEVLTKQLNTRLASGLNEAKTSRRKLTKGIDQITFKATNRFANVNTFKSETSGFTKAIIYKRERLQKQ